MGYADSYGVLSVRAIDELEGCTPRDPLAHHIGVGLRLGAGRRLAAKPNQPKPKWPKSGGPTV